MSENSEVKNPFLFGILCRMVRKEIEQEVNKTTSFSQQINSDNLNTFLNKIKMPAKKADSLYRYLLNDFKIPITKTILQHLVEAGNSTLIGSSWTEFVNLQLNEIKEIPELFTYYTSWEHLTKEIERVINNDVYESNNKTVGKLDIGECQKQKLEKTELTENLWGCHAVLEESLIKRLNQLYPDDLLIIDNIRLSFDEQKILHFIIGFPNGLKDEAIEIIVHSWEYQLLPFMVSLNRLKIKGIVEYKNGNLKIKDEYKDLIQNNEKINLTREFYQVAKAIEKKRYIEDLLNLIYCFQSAEAWEDSERLISQHSDIFKKAGRFKQYAQILERHLQSAYFKENIDPWFYWHLAYCYNMIGDLNKASQTLKYAFDYIQDNCINNNTVGKEYINLFLKSFQLGIDVLINYDDPEILKDQGNAIILVASEYLQIPMYLKEISPEVRWQMLTTFAHFFEKIENQVHSRRIITNLLSDFIEKDASLIKANINLVRIEVFMEEFDLTKLKWATTANTFFQVKRNKNGRAKSLVLMAYYEEENETRTQYLENYLKIVKNIDFYDVNTFKILKNITEKNILSVELQDLLRKEMLRMADIYKKNIEGKANALQIYYLINFKKQIILSEIDLNKLLIKLEDLETNSMGIIASLSTPLDNRLEDFESPEVQRLLASSIDNRIKFLTRKYRKANENLASFYNISSVKWVLLKSLHKRESTEKLMKFYFNDRLIEVIKTLYRDDIKLDYAKGLSRIAPDKSKAILDSVRKKNSEYYNLLGNFYKLSTTEKNYDLSMENYNRAITQEKNKYTRARYNVNCAWLILSFNKVEEFRKVEYLLLSALETKSNLKDLPYAYMGLIALRLMQNEQKTKDEIEEIIHKLLNKLGILINWRVYILEKVLEREDMAKVPGYSVIYSLMKRYANVA